MISFEQVPGLSVSNTLWWSECLLQQSELHPFYPSSHNWVKESVHSAFCAAALDLIVHTFGFPNVVPDTAHLLCFIAMQ